MIINLSDYVTAINDSLDKSIAEAEAKLINNSNAENIKAYTNLTGAATWFNLLISTSPLSQDK